ncbi:hypothetical protein B0H13DRAFT_2318201 [Mycena leptocephala]|nr:hypothetical protein B0H13DRAFT_2318201 [Mycena leptocephala]
MPGPGRSIICACMMEQLGYGRDLGWWPAADLSGGCKCVLGLGSDTAPRPDDATSRRDGPGPAHGWRTWTCARCDFQAPLPAPPAPKRDDADVYAWPEMRVVRSATPHPVFLLIRSLISLPPFFPLIDTIHVVANDTILDGVGW